MAVGTGGLERHPTLDFATGLFTFLRGVSTAPANHASLMAIASGASLQTLQANVIVPRSGPDDPSPRFRETATVTVLNHPVVRAHLNHQSDLWTHAESPTNLSAESLTAVFSSAHLSILAQFLAACATGPIKSNSSRLVWRLTHGALGSLDYVYSVPLTPQFSPGQVPDFQALNLQKTFSQAVIDLIHQLQREPGYSDLKKLIAAVWEVFESEPIAFDIENSSIIAEARYIYLQIVGAKEGQLDSWRRGPNARVSGLSPHVEQVLRDGGRSDLIDRIVDFIAESDPAQIPESRNVSRLMESSIGGIPPAPTDPTTIYIGGPSRDTEVGELPERVESSIEEVGE